MFSNSMDKGANPNIAIESSGSEESVDNEEKGSGTNFKVDDQSSSKSDRIEEISQSAFEKYIANE